MKSAVSLVDSPGGSDLPGSVDFPGIAAAG